MWWEPTHPWGTPRPAPEWRCHFPDKELYLDNVLSGAINYDELSNCMCHAIVRGNNRGREVPPNNTIECSRYCQHHALLERKVQNGLVFLRAYVLLFVLFSFELKWLVLNYAGAGLPQGPFRKTISTPLPKVVKRWALTHFHPLLHPQIHFLPTFETISGHWQKPSLNPL